MQTVLHFGFAFAELQFWNYVLGYAASAYSYMDLVGCGYMDLVGCGYMSENLGCYIP